MSFVVTGFSGCDTLSYYSVMIFKKANINLDEYFMSIVLQVLNTKLKLKTKTKVEY